MNLPEPDLAHIWANLRPLEQLRGKRIFLTGASGFIGNWLMQSIAWANSHLSLSAQIVPLARDAFPTGRFDYGIHAAKAADLEADIQLTTRTLNFALERRARKILFTSSGAVEHSTTDYARAKQASELLFTQAAQSTGLHAVIARLYTFFGPGLPLNANFAIGNFVRDVLAGGPVIIQGDGSAQRSYLYAADLAIWLWTLLLEGASAEPYNVGSSTPISIASLAETVVTNTVPATGIIKQGGEVPGVAHHYVPSVERARIELRLRPFISLEEGIRRMYVWNLQLKNGESRCVLPTTP